MIGRHRRRRRLEGISHENHIKEQLCPFAPVRARTMPNFLRQSALVVSWISSPANSASTSVPDRSKGVVSIAAISLLDSELVPNEKRTYSYLYMTGTPALGWHLYPIMTSFSCHGASLDRQWGTWQERYWLYLL